MRKVCPNCGTPIDDDSIFCPSPKFPEEDSVIETPVPVVKKRLSRNQLLIGSGILAAVIVAIIVLALVLQTPGPATAVSRFSAVCNCDISQFEAMAPDEYWIYKAKQNNTTKSQYLQECIESHKKAYTNAVRDCERLYGTKLQISCTLLYKEKAGKNVVEGVAGALEEAFNIDAGKVKSVYDVIVLYSVEGKDSHPEVDVRSYAAVQIGSDWYLIAYYKMNGSYSAHFIGLG